MAEIDDPFDMPEERRRINEAFASLPNLSFKGEAFQRAVDFFGQAVMDEVEKIYNEALDCPVDWSRSGIEQALPVLHGWLDSHYPWLSRDARRKINYTFIMTWK